MPAIPSNREFLGSDYKKFLDKYHEIYNTEFYMETYPGLDVELETEGWKQYMTRNMNEALECFDATFVLEKYINIVLDCQRYICENQEEFVRLIQICLDAGATFPSDMVFAPKYPDEGNLEDEIQNHYVRAVLIHNFRDFITFPNEWNDLPAVSWEDAIGICDKETLNRAVFSNLKYEVER